MRSNLILLPSGQFFNRSQLVRGYRDRDGHYVLCFTDGRYEAYDGADALAIGNWLKIVAVEAPMVHQPTLFGKE